jgi:hypothetical protein
MARGLAELRPDRLRSRKAEKGEVTMILQSKLSGALVEATLEIDTAQGSPLRGQTLLSIRKPDGSGTVLIAPYKAHEYRISSIDDAEYAVLREAGFEMDLVRRAPGD